MSFGEILRAAREERNEDLLTVARKIRIRPDVLALIEEGNLDEMPPRGYARNMINAYARYVGLNPTEIVKMYQDALFAHQVNQARSQLQPNGFDMPDGRFSTMTGHSDPAATQRINTRRSNSMGRDFVSSSLDDVTMQMNPIGSQGRDGRGRGERVGNSVSNAHYTNIYSAPQNDKNLRSKTPFFIAAIIILLLCLILVFVVNMSHTPETPHDTGTMNVTGMKDSATTPSQDAPVQEPEPQPAPKPAPVLPDKTVISFEVNDGETAYIEIKVDGIYVYVGDVTGPHKESFDVTGELNFVTSGAENLTLWQDDTEVKLESDSGGIANITFTYEEFKTKWEEEHKAEIEAANAATQTPSPAAATQSSAPAASTPVSSTSSSAKNEETSQTMQVVVQ